jgi:hypothetical protein
MPKQYALQTSYGNWIFPWVEYADQLPVTLEPEWRRAFKISMCAEPAEAGLQLMLQLVTERKESQVDLGVSFNGSWPNFEQQPTDKLLFPTGVFTHHTADHQAFNYTFQSIQIKEGWNEVVVFNGNHQRATAEERRQNSITIVSVELAHG